MSHVGNYNRVPAAQCNPSFRTAFQCNNMANTAMWMYIHEISHCASAVVSICGLPCWPADPDERCRSHAAAAPPRAGAYRVLQGEEHDTANGAKVSAGKLQATSEPYE